MIEKFFKAVKRVTGEKFSIPHKCFKCACDLYFGREQNYFYIKKEYICKRCFNGKNNKTGVDGAKKQGRRNNIQHFEKD